MLQRCCWVEEAVANDLLAIPALEESVDDIREWLSTWDTLGVWLDGRLIGMVRGRADGTDWLIGRLAVVPDLRGHGLGRWLLSATEAAAPPQCRRWRLFTGAKSARNIEMYRAAGYHPIDGTNPAIADLAKDRVQPGPAAPAASA